MDDAGSDEARPAVWARVADLQARWVALWPSGWPEDVSRRADARVRRAAVTAARPYATECERPAIDAVIALLDRRIAGDEPARAEWAAARAAAVAVADVVAARAAAWAAEAAAAAAVAAASWAAEEVVAAAACAAEEAVKGAAEETAADALTVAILDIIEAEITSGEHRREGGE
jgi:hypothetical protein